MLASWKEAVGECKDCIHCPPFPESISAEPYYYMPILRLFLDTERLGLFQFAICELLWE